MTLSFQTCFWNQFSTLGRIMGSWDTGSQKTLPLENMTYQGISQKVYVLVLLQKKTQKSHELKTIHRI